MKITTKYISDYEYLSSTEEEQTVKIDMKTSDKNDMSPMQLVLSALSGCVAVEVALMMKKRRKTVENLEIKAQGTRKEGAPRSFTDIHLTFILTSPDAKAEELEKIAGLGLQSYCSVADSLKANITFDCKVVR